MIDINRYAYLIQASSRAIVAFEAPRRLVYITSVEHWRLERVRNVFFFTFEDVQLFIAAVAVATYPAHNILDK